MIQKALILVKEDDSTGPFDSQALSKIEFPAGTQIWRYKGAYKWCIEVLVEDYQLPRYVTSVRLVRGCGEVATLVAEYQLGSPDR